jgi:hypothetical protein
MNERKKTFNSTDGQFHYQTINIFTYNLLCALYVENISVILKGRTNHKFGKEKKRERKRKKNRKWDSKLVIFSSINPFICVQMYRWTSY